MTLVQFRHLKVTDIERQMGKKLSCLRLLYLLYCVSYNDKSIDVIILIRMEPVCLQKQLIHS